MERRPRLRIAAACLLAALAAAAAGPSGAGASCVATVRWQGETYFGAWLDDHPVEVGRRVRDGIVPACLDTVPPDPNERDRPTRLWRVAGVPRGVALAGERDGSLAYVVDRRLTRAERRALRRAGVPVPPR